MRPLRQCIVFFVYKINILFRRSADALNLNLVLVFSTQIYRYDCPYLVIILQLLSKRSVFGTVIRHRIHTVIPLL